MRRAMQSLLAAALTVLLGCSSYYIRRADSAADAGDYETARKLYHQAATDGMNGYARQQLAKIYEHGLGTDPNPVEALRWYKASAALGNSFSQFKAGQLLEDHNESEAEKYYEASAKQGESLAALRLAELILSGRSVDPDPMQAREFLEAAAKQGNIQAAYRLGQLLLEGPGNDSDPKNGIGWLLVAAHSGHALAQAALGRALRDGEGGTAIDKHLAKKWFQEAAQRGNIAAQHELANLVEEDGAASQADKWRMAAAKAGYAPAQIAIAEHCQSTQSEPFCAAFWYAEAAAQGNAYAQYQMGVLTEKGEGVPLSLPEARRWYALAADGDMIAAQERLQALGGS